MHESSPRDGASTDRQLDALPREEEAVPDGASFALCLTHDVDRPYKGFRSLYRAAQERPKYHLRTAVSSSNPYWQFEELMALEDDLGVRSAWYILCEQHLLAQRPIGDWVSAANWIEHLGRYDVTTPELADAVRALSASGWEVGLHGSFHTADDRHRLHEEKARIESVIDEPLTGGRQHHLRLSIPETWRHYRSIGLTYDSSLGSGTECGFAAGYHPIRPFGDEFLVFPLTIMEQALPDPAARSEAARERCDSLLREAATNNAVMTVLWHPRYFNDREFPGYRSLYRWLIERTQDLGGWVGSPAALCETIDHPSETDTAGFRTETTTDSLQYTTK